jgi:hypothetical protein
MENEEPRLTRQEAADFLTVELGLRTSKRTLDSFVTRGGGPLFAHYGRRVYYTESDLRAWVAERLGPKRNCSAQEDLRRQFAAGQAGRLGLLKTVK